MRIFLVLGFASLFIVCVTPINAPCQQKSIPFFLGPKPGYKCGSAPRPCMQYRKSENFPVKPPFFYVINLSQITDTTHVTVRAQLRDVRTGDTIQVYDAIHKKWRNYLWERENVECIDQRLWEKWLKLPEKTAGVTLYRLELSVAGRNYVFYSEEPFELIQK